MSPFDGLSREDLGRIICDAEAERNAAIRRAAVLRDQIEAAKAHISAICGEDQKGSVSDHAVVRFLERARGFDIPGLRREISNAAFWGGAHEGRFEIPYSGVVLICDGGKVITVVPCENGAAQLEPPEQNENET